MGKSSSPKKGSPCAAIHSHHPDALSQWHHSQWTWDPGPRGVASLEQIIRKLWAGEWRRNLIYSSPESLESRWIQIETEDKMTRELAAPTSPPFSLRTSMSRVQDFAFAPEALPGNGSMLKQPGRAGRGQFQAVFCFRNCSECSQLEGGGCHGARRPRKYKYLVQCVPHIHGRYADKGFICLVPSSRV